MQMTTEQRARKMLELIDEISKAILTSERTMVVEARRDYIRTQVYSIVRQAIEDARYEAGTYGTRTHIYSMLDHYYRILIGDIR